MKSKLTEIIESGIAPGISTGAPLQDPNSVYVKAPKGLAAIENEPKWKHGPTRSAKDISRYMGMSSDFIRQTWSKPVLVAFLCFCGAFLRAGDLSSGSVFSDGQTVSAAQMNNIVNNATVNNSLISGKPVDPAPLGSDTLLIFSPTLNGLYRLTLNAGVLQNTTLITAQSEKTTPISADYLLLWDSVGLALKKVSAGNLALNNTNFIFGQPFMQATNLDPQLRVAILNYGTNAQTTASNLFSVQFPLLLTNLPVVTFPTNADLIPIWSTRTNALDTNGATPYLAAIAPHNLGPYTLVCGNIPMTNRPNYCFVTNLDNSPLPYQTYTVLVVTNLQSVTNGYTVGQEIPAGSVLNTAGFPVVSTFSFTNEVAIATTFDTNVLLRLPFAGGNSTNAQATALSYTNFNIKVYITARRQL